MSEPPGEEESDGFTVRTVCGAWEAADALEASGEPADPDEAEGEEVPDADSDDAENPDDSKLSICCEKDEVAEEAPLDGDGLGSLAGEVLLVGRHMSSASNTIAAKM